MSNQKLSSDEVPRKFVDWLLDMGCPAEKIPSLESVTQICRGQYYLVWRSLMEHVEAKDIIKQKRLQVFCEDVRRCRKPKRPQDCVIEPEELSTWKHHHDLQQKVEAAEKNVATLREKLEQILENVSNKLSQRNLTHTDVQNTQRQVWLLQTVAEELRVKQRNLVETRGIADDLTHVDDDADVKMKLDRCLSLAGRRPPPRESQPVACSSMLYEPNASSGNDNEDPLFSLVRAPAAALWSQLCARRAALLQSLVDSHSTDGSTDHKVSVTPQSILAHTAALQCSLSLSALGQRAKLAGTQASLEQAIADLSDKVSGESCELLVLRCDRARFSARVELLRKLRGQLVAGEGDFSAGGRRADVAGGDLARLDRVIIRKKEDIKCLLNSLAKAERKIANVRDTLLSVFRAMQKEADPNDTQISTQLELESGALPRIRHFYQQHKEKRPKMDLSMELDISEPSFVDYTDSATKPTFVDELKFYLRKFNLEDNRKLVLESGEKVWVFETLQASTARLHTRWLTDDVTCSLLCPSVGITENVTKILRDLLWRNELENFAGKLENDSARSKVDVGKVFNKEEEAATMDKIKLRLSSCISTLQKANKTVALGRENMKLWADNPWPKHISTNRTVDNRTYIQYETLYMDYLNPTL